MRTCRQVYHDTTPLAIPNLVVNCHSSAAMIECFVKMGPERITQLRHLVVTHLPMAFQLDPNAKFSKSELAERDSQDGNAAPESPKSDSDGS